MPTHSRVTDYSSVWQHLQSGLFVYCLWWMGCNGCFFRGQGSVRGTLTLLLSSSLWRFSRPRISLCHHSSIYKIPRILLPLYLLNAFLMWPIFLTHGISAWHGVLKPWWCRIPSTSSVKYFRIYKHQLAPYNIMTNHLGASDHWLLI